MKIMKLVAFGIVLPLCACDDSVTTEDFNRADIVRRDVRTAPNRDQFGVRELDLENPPIDSLINSRKAIEYTFAAEDLVGVWRLESRATTHSEWGLSFREMYLEEDGTVIFFDIEENGEKIEPRVWESSYKFDPRSPNRIFFVNRDFEAKAVVANDELFIQLTARDANRRWIKVFRVSKRDRSK